MAAMINITGSTPNDDPSYRYKMPKLLAKTEGRGNGIKTLIMNMSDIATALNRPASLPTKFFGTELGAQSRWEEKEEKATVNGVHTAADLQKLLNVFIDKFVLCPKCHLPETALSVRVSKGLIFHKCSACGAKESVDMSHKLCTFILKEASAALAAEQKEKAARKEAEEAAAKAEGGKAKADKAERKAKKRAEEAAAAAAVAPAAGGDDEDGEADGDDADGAVGGAGTAAAPTAKTAAAPAPAAAAAAAAEEEEDEDIATSLSVTRLRDMIAADATTDADLVAAARTEAVNSGRHARERAVLLAYASFGHSLASSVKNARVMKALKALLHGKDAAKDGQAAFLVALGRILASKETSLKSTGGVLLPLYEGDVLEEDAIVAWYNGKDIPAPVKAAAKEFVEWLTTEEDEEEEEEEEE